MDISSRSAAFYTSSDLFCWSMSLTSGEKEGGGTDSLTRSDSTPTTSHCDSENKKATITSLHKKQFHWVLSTELYEISLNR